MAYSVLIADLENAINETVPPFSDNCRQPNFLEKRVIYESCNTER